MEALKSIVPDVLKQQIAVSTPDDLPSTCSSLLHFFNHLPQFHQTVKDLTDPETRLCGKDKNAALKWKLKGNECFSKGDYWSALHFYSQAIRLAPSEADDNGKNMVATLYVNRAFTLHKVGLLSECLRDCSRTLTISPSYAKSWFRRGKANASLGNYEAAVLDLNVALIMETSLNGRQQIEAELQTRIDNSKGTSSSQGKPYRNTSDAPDETPQLKMQCVNTSMKGRGMASLADIPQASLIHKEDPYAAIISKDFRETHCHFCFNELPADIVPCMSCSMPLYCSQQCQIQAGASNLNQNRENIVIHQSISDNIRQYISDVTSAEISGSDVESVNEHRHECHGAHWPAVLPSEVILAGRIFVKCKMQQKQSIDAFNLQENMNLCNNYAHLPCESKLEMHIYSIILLNCLQSSCASEVPIGGSTISQVVVLLAQIRVNYMAIIRMRALDNKGPSAQLMNSSSQGNDLTGSVQQVRVGQAVYSDGSLFNHSCQPNIHAYFISRTLYIRATEPVAIGSELELSYGPQVGQWDSNDRQQFLKDRYSFSCHCSGCSELNLPDLVIQSYRSIRPSCLGVVLDSRTAQCERKKAFLKADEHTRDDIKKVARHLFERASDNDKYIPGYCLSCGCSCDLQSLKATAGEAEIYFKRLKEALASDEVSNYVLMDALKSTDLLRTTLHPYNKKIAEVEDNLAQAFCLVGELQAALDHCKVSIKILEKLYGPDHIVIGNELVKLASIQLSLSDHSAAESISRVALLTILWITCKKCVSVFGKPSNGSSRQLE